MAGAGPGHGDKEEDDEAAEVEAFWVLPKESDGVGG